MEIINNHIEWNEEDKTITIRKRLCKYDIQCILSKNPRRFVIDVLDNDSLAALKNIRKKIDIPYLQINNIARECDNLINCLPNGIDILNIGYNCWNKKINNLPNSLKSLTMFCNTYEDCLNLPHGIENLTIGLETTTINLSNLSSSIKSFKLINDGFDIDINCIPKSINTLILFNCYDSCIPIENTLEQVQYLCIKNNNPWSVSQVLKKFNNCIDLKLDLLDYNDELLSSISSTVKKITFELANTDYDQNDRKNIL